jgi:hypothetical protein
MFQVNGIYFIVSAIVNKKNDVREHLEKNQQADIIFYLPHVFIFVLDFVFSRISRRKNA